MSVVISRNKKHLALGRLITKASAQLAALSRVRTHLAHSLNILAELSESYAIFQDNGKDLPKKILDEAENERESLKRIASSALLVMQTVSSELAKSSSNMETYHKELDKAEKLYQKEVAKKTPPTKARMIEQVTKALLAQSKDESGKK